MPSHPVFAALYDRLLADAEKKLLGQLRAELLGSAQGRVLELGAGTGLNLDHYGPLVKELALTEPDPHMAKRMRGRIDSATPRFGIEVAEVPAERLPFEDRSFDVVVSTLVLCTVQDAAATIAAAARVLKPDGELLLIEHVRDEPQSRRAHWQDRGERPWGWAMAGCHPNRDTAATLSAAFDVSGLRDERMPGPLAALIKPLIVGGARPLAAG